MVVTLTVAILLAAGSTLGWFAHRAYLHVERWGHAMNEQDDIFRAASQEEVDGAMRRLRVLRFDESISNLQAEPAGAK